MTIVGLIGYTPKQEYNVCSTSCSREGGVVTSTPETAEWRVILGQAIRSPQERERIARVIGVDPATLTRWAKQQSMPRLISLRRLPDALPAYRVQLRESIDAALQGSATEQAATAASEEQRIPQDVYLRVMHTKTTLAPLLLFPTLTDVILEEAIKQFDPERVGVTVTIARCLPAAPGEPVRTLLASVGRGTPPWKGDLGQEAWLLGAESLSGYVVAKGQLEYNQRLSDPTSLAAGYAAPGEQSAAAAPILHTGRIAGSLCVACTQTDYFTPSRLDLVQAYAELLAIAFDSTEFYASQDIQLGMVPYVQQQRTFLDGFWLRVEALMRQASQRRQSLSLMEVQIMVWQQVERELLQAAPALCSPSSSFPLLREP